MALAVDRARDPVHDPAPNEPLDLWRGLVEGRWTLLEQFDADGRRHFVARANDPDTLGRARMTAREKQVIALVVEGHRNKLAAYTLGIGEAAVSLHLRNAMAKLGVKNRLELAGVAFATMGRAT